jgi:hypothetical protein
MTHFEHVDQVRQKPTADDNLGNQADFTIQSNADFFKSANGKLPNMDGPRFQYPTQIEFSDPFASEKSDRGNKPGSLFDTRKAEMKETDRAENLRAAELDNALSSGNVRDIQDMLQAAQTGEGLNNLQDQIDSFNRQHKDIKITLKSDPDRELEPVLQIHTKSYNPDIGCGGHTSSYDIFISDDSAYAVFSSSIGIRSRVNEPVDLTRALKNVQEKLNDQESSLPVQYKIPTGFPRSQPAQEGIRQSH